MIIADTNVLSELMRSATERDPAVSAWIEGLPLGYLATTTVTLAENLAGFRATAPTAALTRKQRIFDEIISTLFEDRLFAFDESAAREYAEVMRERKMRGKPIGKLDAQIAAIARARRLPIATRDRDFADCGIIVVNPWDQAV